MKGYLHYNIWNKEQNLPHVLKSINFFVPKNTILDFSFEDCRDRSFDIFEEFKEIYLKEYDCRVHMASKKYRMKNFNDAISRFMDTDCDFILSPQDDQWIQDSTLFKNIENLYSKEDNVGIVGMRDGFTFSFKNYYSSHFSEKTNELARWLNSGEYEKVKSINDGPLLLSRETIEKVGLFDESMNAFYIENDYCARCIKQGLTNYVMGVELIHLKLSCIDTELYDKDKNFGEIDLSILLSKHPNLYSL
jgi:hypothetical protein